VDVDRQGAQLTVIAGVAGVTSSRTGSGASASMAARYSAGKYGRCAPAVTEPKVT
jgi:hypothetical protein